MPAYYDEQTKSWYCKFYYTDYTGTKKQKKKRGFKLQREAKEWERAFLERLQGAPDMTFQSLYDLYIEESHRLRQNSIDGKKNVFKNRILPYFKDKPVNAITPTDIRAWQNEQIDMGYSDAYLDRIQNMMTTILNYAVTYYNLPSNPCNKAGHMGKRTRSMSFWTLEQYNQFIQHITDISAHTALQLLFYSGMRFGDADGKISLNQQKPSKHAGLRRFGPEKFLQRNNEFMKERPIFYKKPIKTEKDFSTWLRCFYYTTKAVITEYIYF